LRLRQMTLNVPDSGKNRMLNIGHRKLVGMLSPWLLLSVFGCDTLPKLVSPAAPAPAGGKVVQASLEVQQAPTITGSQLQLRPGETAADRAVELTQKLLAAEEEKKALTLRAQQLESALQNTEKSLQDKERALAQTGEEIQAASIAVARTQADLQHWRQEIVGLRERLRSAEKENLVTLQSVAACLEQLLETDRPAVDSKGGNAAETGKPAPGKN
jgi:hypothetical protein